MKRPIFVTGEYYHIYNRGVDRRQLFSDKSDLDRFLESMDEFNSIKPIGSIYENSFLNSDIQEKRKSKKLVQFICYCVNPNHYHFVLKQVSDGGISEFMKRLGGGYTWYFNNKNKRSGALFQGLFKAVHVDTNDYLLHLSAYVNLNFRVHKLGGETAKLLKSSWEEYAGNKQKNFCHKNVILEQFKNKEEYKDFCEESLDSILEQKQKQKEMAALLIDE
ncbi:hypothetical protein A2930_03770 [Candidatus Giovannonibacteria bacterium RIFCSPLOWO2_01_FULL_45_34]|uniref:Transposase IS200-like domain-containing protein n=1 Tax=Candidatus Giovannonibacteria bacterium RIFCSPLOWO2_01_FULL_45_34 TaxID=1798351 RepID=A0A1F5WZ17_9BACT|nr:MAG: hypothetical protein A2930_03770 [Candidatus Giovannonibacteria bacterium RIFCSPLOWO2_01_FULL_45_34]